MYNTLEEFEKANPNRGEAGPWTVIFAFALWYYSDYKILGFMRTVPVGTELITISHDFINCDYNSSRILEFETSTL